MLVLLAIALVTGACGNNTTTPNTNRAADAVMVALTKTAQVGSFRLTWIQTVGPEPVQEYNSLSGVVELAGGRLKFTAVGVTGPAAKVGPGGTPPASSPSDSATTTMICIGTNLWFSNVLAPKMWLHEAIPAGKEIAGLPIGDPGQVFSGLKAHLTDTTAVGRQLIGDVETSHYQGVELLRENDLRWSERVDIWVDTTSLVRQLEIKATTHYPGATTGTGAVPGGTTTETITARFFNFGVRTDIQPPPANQVTNG